MTPVARSWLYVPGHRPDRVAKALVSGADAVVVDLEDSVPADRKDAARAAVLQVATQRSGEQPSDGHPAGPAVWVRLNPVSTAAGRSDVAALAGAPVDGVRIPRAESPDDVAAVLDRLALPAHLLIESAAGLAAAATLARAHPGVVGIGLGEADLAADLLVSHDKGLAWARGAVVVAARAAGLPSPVQSVWTDVTDDEGLRASCRAGRATGFWGRSIIHPRQIAVVHEVYTPDDGEVRAARAVLATAQEAAARGEVATLDADGRFVDPAVVARANVVLARAARSGPRPDAPPTPPVSRAEESP